MKLLSLKFFGMFLRRFVIGMKLKDLLFSESIGKNVEHFPFVIMKPINFP